MDADNKPVRRSDELVILSRYEDGALHSSINVAKWLTLFYADGRNLFLNNIIGTDPVDGLKRSVTPNAATNLLVLSHSRLEVFADLGLEKEYETLNGSVGNVLKNLPNHKPSELLPLNSFGVLPLFTTAYLLNALLVSRDARGADELSACFPFEVALRRVLSAVLLFADQRSPEQLKPDPIHPYILWYMAASLRRLLKLALDNDKFGLAVQTFLRNDTNFTKEIEKIVLPDNKGSLAKAKISETLMLSENKVASSLMGLEKLGIIRYALQVIEDWCATRLMTFLVEAARPELSDFDPSSLAFTMQVLDDADPRRHLFDILQGLGILGRLHKAGQFPAGQAFYSDEKGRSLFVPSIEVANVVLRLLLRHHDALRNPDLTEIIDLTHAVHRRLNERLVAMGRTDGIQGWCTDRAPSKSRIDSWVTTQALEFFVGRIALLRAMKRRLVFQNYSWHSAANNANTAPRWEKLADPNRGTKASLLKDDICQVVEKRTKVQAPIFLLYGPPGTSKTTFAKSFASLKHWDIVFLSPSDFVADSTDLIEMRSRDIFVDIMNLNNTVILLDEMDSLFLDRRQREQQSAAPVMEFVVPAFLTKLQDLRDYATRRNIAVFINTNFYERVDRAISRPGRIDNHLLVLPYSRDAQIEVVEDLLEKRGVEKTGTVRTKVVDALQHHPCNLGFRDIDRLVSIAIELPTVSVKDLQQKLEHLGVQPEEYEYKSRASAYVEFVNFSRRLVGEDVATQLAFQGSRQDAAIELHSIVRKMGTLLEPARTLHNRWERAIREWAENLGGRQ